MVTWAEFALQFFLLIYIWQAIKHGGLYSGKCHHAKQVDMDWYGSIAQGSRMLLNIRAHSGQISSQTEMTITSIAFERPSNSRQPHANIIVLDAEP